MIGLPKMLSFLIYGDMDAEVKGLKSFKKEDRPPVFISFATYHIMIMLGMLFVIMALFSGFLLIRKKLTDNKWYLRLMLFAIPLPYIANETGWIAAEVGRQPWVVYHVLRTKDAISKVVPSGQILFSLILFILVYTLLFLVFMKVVLKIIKKGPETDQPINQEQGG
jgi:cytochrome d ubiquinol oxidase subunit I